MDGEKGCRVRLEIVEHSDKRTARQRLGNLPQGLLREAESRQGPDDRQFGIVGRQRSLDPDRARAHASPKPPVGMEMPAIVENEATVAGEILESLRRPALREIGWAGHNDPTHLEQAPAHEA